MTKIEKGVKQLENGSWMCDKVYKGVRISFKRKTKTEAVTELKSRIKGIDEDFANEIIQRKNKEEMTFDKLFELYGKSRQWISCTYIKSRARFEKYFKEFKDLPLKKITNESLMNWVSKIYQVRDSRTISSDYANRIMGIMKGMLLIAKDEGYCSKMIQVGNIVFYKTPPSMMRSEKLENNYLLYDEFKTLIKKLPEIPKIDNTGIDNSFYVFVISVLYYTGCRINEARAIQVKDINKSIERRNTSIIPIYYISVTKQMEDNTSIQKNYLKGGIASGRRVYIKKEVYDYIVDYCKRAKYNEDSYIFDYFNNGMPITRKTISRNLISILKKMHELNLVDDSFPTYISPHGFRYSNTLYLKKLGVSIEMAAKMQGHNVSTMLDIYSRIDKNEIGDIFGE